MLYCTLSEPKPNSHTMQIWVFYHDRNLKWCRADGSTNWVAPSWYRWLASLHRHLVLCLSLGHIRVCGYTLRCIANPLWYCWGLAYYSWYHMHHVSCEHIHYHDNYSTGKRKVQSLCILAMHVLNKPYTGIIHSLCSL